MSASWSGSVWDLETGTPVLVYSWSQSQGGVSLPFKLGIPFAVGVSASASYQVFTGFPMGGGLASIAVVSVRPAAIPEPGTFALMLSALAAMGVLNARRNRRT
jgi:hypothetical protein